MPEGIDSYDWFAAGLRRGSQPVRGTNISIQPQSTGQSVCIQALDDSVIVGGQAGLAIDPNSVYPWALTTNIYPAPTFSSYSITPYDNLAGMLQDIKVDAQFSNVPQDGTVKSYAWALRKTQTPGKLLRVVNHPASTNAALAFTNLTVPANGNLVVAVFSHDMTTLQAVAGWPFIENYVIAGGQANDANVAVNSHVWNLADTLTESIATVDSFNAVCITTYEFKGADSKTPFNVHASATMTAITAGGALTSPSVTPTQTGCEIVAAFVLANLPAVNGYTLPTTSPSLSAGWVQDNIASAGGSAGQAVGVFVHRTATNTDTTTGMNVTATFDSTWSGTLVAVTIAVNISGVFPWVIQAETPIGNPFPPTSSAGEYSFGQITLGIGYDVGAAYVSTRGDIGQIGTIATNYVPIPPLSIPNHYLIGNSAYQPALTTGIPAGYLTVLGGEASNTPTAVPTAVQVTSANGITVAINIAFQWTNVPQDGSASRIGWWYRQANQSPVAKWSYYGGTRVPGIGLPPPTATSPTNGVVNGVLTYLPPAVAQEFEYADLILGTSYDFGMSVEDTQGDETDIIFIVTFGTGTSTVLPTGSFTGNLIPDPGFGQTVYGAYGLALSPYSSLWRFSWMDGLNFFLNSNSDGYGSLNVTTDNYGRDCKALSAPFPMSTGTYTLSFDVYPESTMNWGLVKDKGANSIPDDYSNADVMFSLGGSTNPILRPSSSWTNSDASLTTCRILFQSNGSGGFATSKPQFEPGPTATAFKTTSTYVTTSSSTASSPTGTATTQSISSSGTVSTSSTLRSTTTVGTAIAQIAVQGGGLLAQSGPPPLARPSGWLFEELDTPDLWQSLGKVTSPAAGYIDDPVFIAGTGDVVLHCTTTPVAGDVLLFVGTGVSFPGTVQKGWTQITSAANGAGFDGAQAAYYVCSASEGGTFIPIQQAVLSAWRGTLYHLTNTNALIPPIAPALSQSALGTIAATTYYARVAYVYAGGSSVAGPESIFTVSANNVLVIASPAAQAGATGYDVYVSTATGAETKQNTAAIAIGTAWTEPTTGLIAGTALPAATGLIDVFASASNGSASPSYASSSVTTTGVNRLALSFVSSNRIVANPGGVTSSAPWLQDLQITDSFAPYTLVASHQVVSAAGAIANTVTFDANCTNVAAITICVNPGTGTSNIGSWKKITVPALKRTKEIKMSSADFTPTAIGVDTPGLYVVPWDESVNTLTSMSWQPVSLFMRAETPGTATTSVKLQRYTGTGTFSNTGYVNATSVDLASGMNEPAANPAYSQFTSAPALNSGDKIKVEYTALGAGVGGITLIMVLREV